jgi:hypothetical protein
MSPFLYFCVLFHHAIFFSFFFSWDSKYLTWKWLDPRRDRIVERFAMLLSQAAGTSADDSETDESRVCGSPGKVLDAALLQQLLCEIQPQHQLFYGPSKAINFDRAALCLN